MLFVRSQAAISLVRTIDKQTLFLSMKLASGPHVRHGADESMQTENPTASVIIIYQ